MAHDSLFVNLEHPAALGSFRSWLRLVRESERIEARYVPRLLVVASFTLLTSPLRLIERMVYGRALSRVVIDPEPIFVVGHWRTGTTFVHHLLCQDPRLGYVSTFQAMAPGFCLIGGPALRPVLGRIVARLYPTRLIDSVPLRLDAPQEDDYAVAASSPYSFLHAFTLPRQATSFFERYALLHGLPERTLADWRETYLGVLRKATLMNGGKRLALKSPVNSGRIPAILELFPKAKFIHVTRNPYDVFLSTVHTYQTVLPRSQLHGIDGQQIEDTVLQFYERMMRQFLADQALIGPGNLAEVRFEDLEADALGQMRRIYEELDLGGFAEAEPALRKHLASVADYRKNQYKLTDEVIEAVNRHWSFAFEAWGYPRLAPSYGPASERRVECARS